MKQIKPGKKITLDTKTKLLGLAGFLIILSGLSVSILKGINAWFDTHTFVFAKPVEIQFNKPISIHDRELEVQEIIRIIETIPAPEDLETEVEKKIYETFGVENYRVAISIAKAESGLNCDAVNAYNSNGTVDLSVFQINSSWIDDYSLAEISNCMRNIEIAYEIWDRGDGEVGNNKGSWSPWVAARSGAHIKFLE